MIPAALLPLAPYAKAVGRFLAAGVTIPIWLIIAAAGWAHFDKQSAVRAAVVKLVAGEEIAAARATAEANAKLRAYAEGQAAEATRRAQAAEAANAAFAQRAAEAERLTADLQDEINERLSAPISDACVVDDDLRRRLRN